MKRPELLAPAGDLERLETALRFGADAVYVGGPMLQLRAGSAGFCMNDLEKAVSAVHGAGKKMYIAVNAVTRNGELPALADYAVRLQQLGADAVIVSDIGAIRVIRRAAPSLPVHVSTQANCLNYESVLMYRDLGASRVILGREATLEEISEIRSRVPEEVELECFIHGAMCMAYSGRCILSAYLHGRSANRGECSQPCRYVYSLRTEGVGDELSVLEDGDGTTILSSRDLNAMPFLDRLIATGVSSLKIEGRMKSTYYVATVVNAYRKRLDGVLPLEDCLRELDCASHRPYTSGFYLDRAAADPSAGPDYSQDCVFVAMVLKAGNGTALIEQRNPFRVGDVLEVLSPDSSGLSFPVGSLMTPDGVSRESAPHPKERLLLPCPVPLSPGDILRRRT